MPAWLLWTLLALLCWGIWAVLSKLLGAALSAEQSQALSTLGLIPILLPLAWSARGSLRGIPRRGLALALLGGIVTCLGTIQVSRAEFLNFGKQAKSEGISYLGGCCGCNAAYIRALARGLKDSAVK